MARPSDKYYIQVERGQSIEDVSIQEYGGFEAAGLIWCDNQLEPDSILKTGQVLCIRKQLPDSLGFLQEFRDFFAERKERECRVVNCGDWCNYGIICDTNGEPICDNDGCPINYIIWN